MLTKKWLKSLVEFLLHDRLIVSTNSIPFINSGWDGNACLFVLRCNVILKDHTSKMPSEPTWDIYLKCKNSKVLQQHHVDMVFKNMLKQAIHAIRIYEYRLSFQFRNCHEWKFVCSHANFLIHKGSRVKINMQINSSITHWLQAISKFSLVTETREIILALRGCQSYLFR